MAAAKTTRSKKPKTTPVIRAMPQPTNWSIIIGFFGSLGSVVLLVFIDYIGVVGFVAFGGLVGAVAITLALMGRHQNPDRSEWRVGLNLGITSVVAPFILMLVGYGIAMFFYSIR